MKFGKYINESSLSRIWKFVNDDSKSFGVISAYRSYYSTQENKKRHLMLKKDVRIMGYGFIEMRGGYVETIDDEKIEVQEDSLFIPKIKKNDIMKLGTEYEQDSVLYKDTGYLYEIGTTNTYGIGKNIQKFKLSGDNITLAKDAISQFYSRLKKGSHRNKKFQLKEKHDTGMSQVFHKKLDDIWVDI